MDFNQIPNAVHLGEYLPCTYISGPLGHNREPKDNNSGKAPGLLFPLHLPTMDLPTCQHTQGLLAWWLLTLVQRWQHMQWQRGGLLGSQTSSKGFAWMKQPQNRGIPLRLASLPW